MTVVEGSYYPPRSAPTELVRRAWDLYKRAATLYADERRTVRSRLAQRLRALYTRLKRRALLQATNRAQRLLEQQLLMLVEQWQQAQVAVRRELASAAELVIREIVAVDVQHPLALKARVESLMAQRQGQPAPQLVLHPADRERLRSAMPQLLASYEITEDVALERGCVGIQIPGGRLVLNWQSHMDRLLAGMRRQLIESDVSPH